MDGHFFVHAPILPWSQWIWRRLGFQPHQEPSLLTETTLSKTVLPESPTGVPPQRAKAECAIEYSTFLATHFYSAESPIQLLVPPKLFQEGLEKGHLVGVEIRTKDGSIAGIMFCLYSGLLRVQTIAESTGTITWHCVHPSWRKRGVPNALLRSIYIFTQPRNVYWFRNDGFLKPSIPPTWSEWRIQRKKGSIHVVRSNTNTNHPVRCSQVFAAKWQEQLKEAWLQKYPEGLILEDSRFKYGLVEWWELTVRPGVYCVVVLQPTFEVQRAKVTTKLSESWCEVIAWHMTSQQITSYELAQYIETTLDATPYTWFDAPYSMPHGESQWKQAGISNWSAFGLDIGVPIQRPMLSLCTV
jgi:ribosomal protein S18 acetylase RimI-like enzyme